MVGFPVRTDTRRSNPFLSIVIPTYNEAENIESFIAAVRASLEPTLGGSYEVIVVDDDSPDETWKTAGNLAATFPQTRVLRRQGERGVATAVVRGWQVARGEVLATINADFQHPPSLLAAMLQEISHVDLVVATRYAQAGSVGNFPRHRQFLSNCARRAGELLIPGVFGRVSDPLSGCYLFRRGVIEGVELRPAGFKSLIEVLARGRVQSVAECGYSMEARRRGCSKVRWQDWLEYMLQIRRLHKELGRRPTR